MNKVMMKTSCFFPSVLGPSIYYVVKFSRFLVSTPLQSALFLLLSASKFGQFLTPSPEKCRRLKWMVPLTTEDGCITRKWPAEHSRESHPKHNFFSYGWSIFVCQFGPNISYFYDLHWVSVFRGFDHTLWFHKFWTFSWKMSLKICKDVCECICRGQGRRNKKLLVNNLWGLLRSYAIMQMVRRRRICVVIEFEIVSTTN